MGAEKFGPVRLGIRFHAKHAKKRIITKARNVLKANAAKIENTKKGESLDGHQPDLPAIAVCENSSSLATQALAGGFSGFISCFRTFVFS